MAKHERGYRALLQQLRERLELAGEVQTRQLNELIKKSEAYLEAAGDLTKDEWALISRALRRDMEAFSEHYLIHREEVDRSVWLQNIRESVWHWLTDLCDRSQIEWTELTDDLEHQGEYRAGELVGYGVLVCTNCGHKTEIYHPAALPACLVCGGQHFTRVPFDP